MFSTVMMISVARNHCRITANTDQHNVQAWKDSMPWRERALHWLNGD
jgi:hypothetical protein